LSNNAYLWLKNKTNVNFKEILADKSAWVRLLFLICAALASVFVIMIVLGLASGFAAQLMHLPARAVIESINFLKIAQLLTTFSLFLLPALFLAYVSSHSFARVMLNKTIPNLWSILLVTAIFILIQPIMNLMVDWGSHIPLTQWMIDKNEANEKLLERFLNVHTGGALLLNWLVVALLPAIGEEFFFRGSLQRLFAEKMNIHVAIWLSALLFSLVHVEFSAFIPRVFLGACLGYMLAWSGSIWLPVLGHLVNNTIGVAGSYLLYNHHISNDVEQIGTGSMQWFAWVTLVIALAFIWLLKKTSQKNLPHNDQLG